MTETVVAQYPTPNTYNTLAGISSQTTTDPASSNNQATQQTTQQP